MASLLPGRNLAAVLHHDDWWVLLCADWWVLLCGDWWVLQGDLVTTGGCGLLLSNQQACKPPNPLDLMMTAGCGFLPANQQAWLGHIPIPYDLTTRVVAN
eukprot:366399-Chlamydomonas_euryale.AAC.11